MTQKLWSATNKEKITSNLYDYEKFLSENYNFAKILKDNKWEVLFNLF